MLYTISKFIARVLCTPYFRLRVEGREHIPKEGGCILVANHVSFLDPILIGAVMPRKVHYLTYAVYYYARLLHWYCKRAYCIPIKKDGKDISGLKKALRLLKSGNVVGIFPEGKRSWTGQLQPAEPGVALIALRAGVPVLPVGICGAYEAFPRGSKFPRPRRITIIFGKPFQIDEQIAIQKNTQKSEVQQHVLDLIMSRIADVCPATSPKAIA
jgi:1-acyl-sn-glycerol-3-phosphate acyltransferase